MYLIAGLGNPGLSYRKSRHNAGFLALDVLADRMGVRVRQKEFSGLTGQTVYAGEKLVLCKPQTYMNLSGNCIGQLLHFYKLPPERLIVLYDDIDLPVGALRVRPSGSAGTHNGMRSIVANVHADTFPRVRIGIGKDEQVLLTDYVLKRPSKPEMALLVEAFSHAADAALLIVEGRIDQAQQQFNKKHEGKTV